jgi:undecaprenyl-diphosphatase
VTDFDLAWFQRINASADSAQWIVHSALFISKGLPLVVAAALAVGLCRRSTRSTAASVLVAMALTWCIVHLFHALVPLPRPAALNLGTQWIDQGNRPGFPSMHVSVAFAMASALWFRHSRWTVAALLLGVAMAWSRVCIGVHFPRDVLAAALVGALAAGFSVPLLQQLKALAVGATALARRARADQGDCGTALVPGAAVTDAVARP